MHLRHPKGVVSLNKALGDNSKSNVTVFGKYEWKLWKQWCKQDKMSTINQQYNCLKMLKAKFVLYDAAATNQNQLDN